MKNRKQLTQKQQAKLAAKRLHIERKQKRKLKRSYSDDNGVLAYV